MTTVYGVDFSGAAYAGNATWVSQAHIDGDVLHVERCVAARDLPGGGRQRKHAYDALRALIAGAGDAVFGLDFPLSLPLPILGAQSWRDFLMAFAQTYPTAQTFHDAAHRATDGRELRRACERIAKAPFAAYNLRLYLQTYYGLRDLVAPLVAAGAAVVLPMQDRLPGQAALVEICPASTLKQRQLYAGGPYKGRDAGAAEHRAALLTWLDREGVRFAGDISVIAIGNSGGDALDSLIAVYATAEALRRGDFDAEPSDLDRREGRIYF